MSMKTIHALLCGAALALSAPAMAQGVAMPDTAALAAARDLMAATDIRGQLKAIGPSLAKAVDEQMKSMFSDGQMPSGLQKQLTGIMADYLGSMDEIYTPELIDQLANIYARRFSADELRHVAEMMKDPVMIRFREQTPAITADLLPLVLEAVKPRQAALLAKVKSTVAQWVADHPNDKAKLRQSTKS